MHERISSDLISTKGGTRLVDLGQGTKPLVRHHYPHMLAEDTGVWTKFPKTDSFRPQEVWYDVRVGKKLNSLIS